MLGLSWILLHSMCHFHEFRLRAYSEQKRFRPWAAFRKFHCARQMARQQREKGNMGKRARTNAGLLLGKSCRRRRRGTSQVNLPIFGNQLPPKHERYKKASARTEFLLNILGAPTPDESSDNTPRHSKRQTQIWESGMCAQGHTQTVRNLCREHLNILLA